MKAAPPLLATLLAAAAFAAPAPRERYQPIIDAKPFGDAEATALDASAAEIQQQKEELAQKFRMCGITDMPDGARKIAFIDETSGTPVNYFLGIGESENGFTLIAADYDAETATLTKDGLTLTLGLGKGLIDTPEAGDAEPAPKAAAAPAQGSFRDRLLRRQAAKEQAQAERRAQIRAEIRQNVAAEAAVAVQAAAQAAKEQAQAEVVEQAERRRQIERIKRGLPPTRPITLTAAEDAELEAAGVFRQPAAQPKQDGPAQDPAPEADAPGGNE